MVLKLQDLLYFGRKCCMVVVVVVVHTLLLHTLACSLFNFTVSAATDCSYGLFIMNTKAFRTK